uniref:Endonuclease/exonuclease/phosphatase domain-containing protein n=1 Tax=Chenopodium quinoa TaxID=63459 RepID=A0A803M5J3_CHEQI
MKSVCPKKRSPSGSTENLMLCSKENGAEAAAARGLGQANSSKVPYIASLVRSYVVDIVFLAETMVSVHSVLHKLSSLSCSDFVGVDSMGLRGGLCVFWFAPVVVEPLLVSPHVILCQVVENLVIKHVLCLYGAPQVSDRMTMWSEISDILASYPNVVIVGDFNQVEYLSDKAGGNLDIPGRHDFIQWKLDNGLLDIPFSGLSFTWTMGEQLWTPL